MSTELIKAIKEQVDLGHSDEQISEELRSTGYNKETIQGIIAEARSDGPNTVVSKPPQTGQGELISSSTANIAFPGTLALLSNAFNFVKSRLDLLLLLAVPAILVGVFDYIEEPFLEIGGGLQIAVTGIVFLAFIIFYILVGATSLYLVAESSNRRVSISEGFTWAKQNINNVIWINILVTLVVVGGYVLLLIPGIILSLVLIFSRFAYVKEGKKGLSALLRSRDLVKGNWWQVFGAFFIVSAIMLVGLIVGAIMIGFAIPLISSSVTIVEIVNVLILTFVGVAVQLATLHITLQLFEHLRSIGPSSVSQEEEVGRCKYKTLAWLSFIIFILAISLASLNDAREKSLENRLIEPTEISDSLAKERALELRTESITQLE